MLRLAIDLGVVPRLFANSSASVPSSIDEEVLFSSSIGASVLVFGRSGEGAQPEYFALATLGKFTSGVPDQTFAQLTDIRRLRVPVERSAGSVSGRTIYRLPEEEFVGVVAGGNLDAGAMGELMQAPYSGPSLPTYAAVTKQLAERQGGRCSFSGVVVGAGEGVAVPIKPRDVGGELHVRQCLFLHDEPAHLFNMFAWTVGPDHEIVVDSWRVGLRILATINPLGKLLVTHDQAWWPDEAMLAWHRQRFFERLK